MVPREGLRVLGPEVISVRQLIGWFGSVNDSLLKVAEKHPIGAGGDDFFKLIVWMDAYVMMNNIDTSSVLVCAGTELRAKVRHHLKRSFPRYYTHPKHLKDHQLDVVMGYPIQYDADRNYIFIPFHPLIEIKVLPNV